MFDKLVASTTSLSIDTQEFTASAAAEEAACYVTLPAVIGTCRVAMQLKNTTAGKQSTVKIYTWLAGAWVQIGTANNTTTTYAEVTMDIELYRPYDLLRVTYGSAVGGIAMLKNIEIRGTATAVESDSNAEGTVVNEVP